MRVRSEVQSWPLVLPLLLTGETLCEVLYKQAIGLGRDDEFLRGLLDREFSGVLFELLLCMDDRGRDLLLGGSEYLALFFFDRLGEALLFLCRVLLRLRAHRGDLSV